MIDPHGWGLPFLNGPGVDWLMNRSEEGKGRLTWICWTMAPTLSALMSSHGMSTTYDFVHVARSQRRGGSIKRSFIHSCPAVTTKRGSAAMWNLSEARRRRAATSGLCLFLLGSVVCRVRGGDGMGWD